MEATRGIHMPEAMHGIPDDMVNRHPSDDQQCVQASVGISPSGGVVGKPHKVDTWAEDQIIAFRQSGLFACLKERCNPIPGSEPKTESSPHKWELLPF